MRQVRRQHALRPSAADEQLGDLRTAPVGGVRALAQCAAGACGGARSLAMALCVLPACLAALFIALCSGSKRCLGRGLSALSGVRRRTRRRAPLAAEAGRAAAAERFESEDVEP